MTTRRPSRTNRRRGLAPLELVLSLPMLLLMMALMVGLGAAACWKVRSQVVAQNMLFAGRSGRSYLYPYEPKPGEWQANYRWGDSGAGDLAALDVPPLQQPVARGPLPGGVGVRQVLDPKPGMREGHTDMRRTPPLLARFPQYEYHVRQQLLDNRWQYWQMGMGSNVHRRIRVLYDLPEQQNQQPFQQALSAILSSPQRPALDVLDRDQELASFYGAYFDFHPRLNGFCSLDAEQIRNNNVKSTIERIQGRPPPRRRGGVPERMTSTFLRRYRDELAILNSTVPPTNPARIAQLEQLIEQLEDYQTRLRGRTIPPAF